MWSIGRSDPPVGAEAVVKAGAKAGTEASDEAALPLPLEIRAIRNARRMRLRIDEGRGVLKLTCPPRTSRRAAVRWALEQRQWIAAQLAGAAPGEPFAPGSAIPFAGRDLWLVAEAAAPRTGRREGDRLLIGGPANGFSRRVEAWLRGQALATLSAEVAEFAERAGVRASAVAIGDAATRWGSCSSSGRIRFNWRLICAPPAVRRFVVAHEVAHLRHLDHGPRFRALEAELAGPGVARARAELRALGPRLRRLGRG